MAGTKKLQVEAENLSEPWRDIIGLLLPRAWRALVAVHFEVWQWILFAVAAAIIGMSKCGIPGLGILNVAIFQNLMVSKEATGFGLPLLIAGDLVAMVAYKRHADWGQLWRLFPWTAVGVVGGYLALKSIDDRTARIMIGSLLAGMLVLHVIRQRMTKDINQAVSGVRWLAPIAGASAGFISLVANAAGPVMIIYLLAMRLPKMAFMGTSVFFFFFMNLFKVPFLAQLDLITFGSLADNLKLAPFVVAGGLLGYFVATKMNQKVFEGVAFWLTVVAVAHMLWLAFE